MGADAVFGEVYQVRLRVRKWPSRNYKVRVHQQSHKTSSSTLTFTLLTFISPQLFDMLHTCTLTQCWWLSLQISPEMNDCVMFALSLLHVNPVLLYSVQSYKICINKKNCHPKFTFISQNLSVNIIQVFRMLVRSESQDNMAHLTPKVSCLIEKHGRLWGIMKDRAKEDKTVRKCISKCKRVEVRRRKKKNKRTEHSGTHDAEQTEWIREEKIE